MTKITLEQIHQDIIGLKKEIKDMKILIEEDFELADDVVKDIEESRKRQESEFISNKEMRKEFA